MIEIDFLKKIFQNRTTEDTFITSDNIDDGSRPRRGDSEAEDRGNQGDGAEPRDLETPATEQGRKRKRGKEASKSKSDNFDERLLKAFLMTMR